MKDNRSVLDWFLEDVLLMKPKKPVDTFYGTSTPASIVEEAEKVAKAIRTNRVLELDTGVYSERLNRFLTYAEVEKDVHAAFAKASEEKRRLERQDFMRQFPEPRVRRPAWMVKGRM